MSLHRLDPDNDIVILENPAPIVTDYGTVPFDQGAFTNVSITTS